MTSLLGEAAPRPSVYPPLKQFPPQGQSLVTYRNCEAELSTKETQLAADTCAAAARNVCLSTGVKEGSNWYGTMLFTHF